MSLTSCLIFLIWFGISCEGSFTSSSSSALAETAIMHSADCLSFQDKAIFHSQRRTLPSDMESEPQICEMLDLLLEVKDYTDR